MMYTLRNHEEKIRQLLTMFPVVVILGARQVGKSSLAKHIMPEWQYFDLEKPSQHTQIMHDPELFFEQFPRHIILDEAQRLPQIFEILRGVIDEHREENGRFLVTGSSSPLLNKYITESLAGRVAIVELGTLKANEIAGEPLGDFYRLFSDSLSKDMLPQGKPPLSTELITQSWLRGGYPQPVLSEQEAFYEQWMENYQATYIQRDIRELFPNLDLVTYQRFLGMLARVSGTVLNRSDLARALEVSEGSVRKYLQIAEGTYLWRGLNSYERSVTKSIIKMPRGSLRDTGLLHHLLHIRSYQQLFEHPIVGYSFEQFVIEEIINGLSSTMSTAWHPYYFRTRAGAEVDLILDGPFGTLPIEIKYGKSTAPSKLKALEQFVENNNLPFGLLINQSDHTQWVTRKIYQLPVGFI